MNNLFKPSNKDNLTDVVAVISQNAPAPVPTPAVSSNNGGGNGNQGNTPAPIAPAPSNPPQQVIASNGDVVTLGYNPFKK